MFLEECKHVEKKTSKFITDSIEISFNDSDKKHSDEEILIKEILMKRLKHRMLFGKIWVVF